MRKGAGFIPALFILRIQPLGLHPRSLSGRLRDRRMPSCFDGSNRAGPWRARDLWSDNIYYVNFKTFRVESPWNEAVAPWSVILIPSTHSAPPPAGRRSQWEGIPLPWAIEPALCTNHLLRPRIWPSFRESSGLAPYDVLTKYASGPSPCGSPVARPAPRSRYGVSCIMRASFFYPPRHSGEV